MWYILEDSNHNKTGVCYLAYIDNKLCGPIADTSNFTDKFQLLDSLKDHIDKSIG